MTSPVVDAWARWDRLPRDERSANAMEQVCTDTARTFGITTTVYRARLAAARRNGMTQDEAVASLKVGQHVNVDDRWLGSVVAVETDVLL